MSGASDGRLGVLAAVRIAVRAYRSARSHGLDLAKEAETMQCCNPGIDVRIGALIERNRELEARRPT